MVVTLIRDSDLWDKFVYENDVSSVFHLWKFLNVIAKHSKYDLLSYGIYKGEELIGIIPLFYKNLGTFKFLFSPPPMSAIPYLGILMKKGFINLRSSMKEDYINYVSEELNNEISKIGADYCSITFLPYIKDIRYFKNKNYIIDTKYTYLISLENNLEDIRSKFKKNTRKKIERANSLNLLIKEVDDPSIVYNSIKKRYKEQKINVPILSEAYLNDLKNELPGEVIMRVVENDGKIIGSEILLGYKNVMWDWLGGSRPDVNVPVNEFLKWNIITQSKTSNYIEIDLVGANNHNISNFKVQFEPELVTYYSITRKNFKGVIAELIYYDIIKNGLF